MTAMTVIPDKITPEIGWRQWICVPEENGMLRSPTATTRWFPGEAQEAKCNDGSLPTPMPGGQWVPRKGGGTSLNVLRKQQKNNPFAVSAPSVELPDGWGYIWEWQSLPEDEKGHIAPESRCGCGIYAVKTLSDLHARGYLGFRDEEIVGKVALWGKVVPGTDGWRGQYAYPVELFASNRRRRQFKKMRALLEPFGVPVHEMSKLGANMT